MFAGACEPLIDGFLGSRLLQENADLRADNARLTAGLAAAELASFELTREVESTNKEWETQRNAAVNNCLKVYVDSWEKADQWGKWTATGGSGGGAGVCCCRESGGRGGAR